MNAPEPRLQLEKKDYESLSDFRYQLRRFLRFSEAATRMQGITPLQYVLLLHVKGYPGREWATVGELAERLQSHHHGTVALVTRCEKLGLVERRQCDEDRRRVEIHLTEKGERCLDTLAHAHRTELLTERLTAHVQSLKSLSPPASARF
jgi:DNA-binding MarR family transcriptional regulator